MSQLNPSEISSVLKEKIAGLDLSAERKNEGIVVSVSDGIVRIHGMGDVMYGEVIEFENGTKGMALNLEQDSVGAVVLGDYLEIIEGQKALCTGKVLEVPVGEGLLIYSLRNFSDFLFIILFRLIIYLVFNFSYSASPLFNQSSNLATVP